MEFIIFGIVALIWLWIILSLHEKNRKRIEENKKKWEDKDNEDKN